MKKFLAVTFWSGVLTLARMASGLLIAKAVAVYTGPVGVAMLGQVQSLVGVLVGVVASPGGNGLVRYSAQNRHKGFDACAPWWSASLKWSLLLLAPVTVLAAITSVPVSVFLFETGDYAWAIWIVCVGLPFAAANTFVNSILNGLEDYRRYVALGLVSVVASTIVLLTLIWRARLDGALAAAAATSAVSGAIMLVGAFGQPWFKLTHWCHRVRREHIKGIGGYVAMAVTTAITGPLSMMAVRRILVSEVGWIEAGQWQAVYKISEVYLGVITVALSTYFLPRLSALVGYEAIRSEVLAAARVVIPAALILALGIYTFRDVAIALLFSSEFSSARDLFAIQLVGDVIKILSWLYAFPMISRGATRWFIGTELAFSLSFPALVYALVGMFGTEGAVMSYALNYLVYLIVVAVNLKRIAG